MLGKKKMKKRKRENAGLKSPRIIVSKVTDVNSLRSDFNCEVNDPTTNSLGR